MTAAEATEFIDIGGPTMIRAAAKNFAHVSILTSPEQYGSFIEELEEKMAVSFETRQKLAKDAFAHTADYDTAIANYFTKLIEEHPAKQFNVSSRYRRNFVMEKIPISKPLFMEIKMTLSTASTASSSATTTTSM